MENMSLSDIAAVTRGNDDGDGWGGNGAWCIRGSSKLHVRRYGRWRPGDADVPQR